MRVLPAASDHGGPLIWARGRLLRSLEGPVRVFDLCDDADAYEAMTGEVHSPGALMHADKFVFVLERRSELDCSGAAVGDGVGDRYATRNYLDDLSLSFWASAEEAVREGGRLAQQQRDRILEEPEGYVSGFLQTPAYADLGGDQFLAIEYPLGELEHNGVEVLAESVSVSGGVLRGLVRNWSRDLWAYGTTISAGGSAWRWPLSIQPGETAPFEFTVWAGLDDPARIEFRIDAEMSPEVDLSRAVDIYAVDDPNTYTVWAHGLPASALDAFPLADDFDPAVDDFDHWYGVGMATSWVTNPYHLLWSSYPSLTDVTGYFTIRDVAVYVASMDGRAVARVAEVPLLSIAPLGTEAWEQDRLIEINQFPARFDRDPWTSSDGIFVYYIPDRSWTHRIWIGGVHLAG